MTTMVVPAEEQGWEVWESGKLGMEQVRVVDGGLEEAGLLSGVSLALPVHAMASMPLIVQSSDMELCEGATQLLLERAGLVDEDNEDSWDAVIVQSSSAGSLVVGHAYLEDIFPEGALLKDVVVDYSPRCYDVGSGDKIVCWREQGRWALVCYKEGKPFYSEPLGKELGESVLRSVYRLLSPPLPEFPLFESPPRRCLHSLRISFALSIKAFLRALYSSPSFPASRILRNASASCIISALFF